jgi:hypothetical protein
MWREMYSLSAVAVASRAVPILAKFIFVAQPWQTTPLSLVRYRGEQYSTDSHWQLCRRSSAVEPLLVNMLGLYEI